MVLKNFTAAKEATAPSRSDALNWVSVEVRKSLSIAIAAITHWFESQPKAEKSQKNSSSSSIVTAPNLKSAQAEMYKAAGALRMLRQFACADICKDLGTILQQIKQDELAPQADLLKAVKSSQYAVSAYLTGLENGKNWPETVLLPVVEMIAQHAKRFDVHPAHWWIQSTHLAPLLLPIQWSLLELTPQSLEKSEIEVALLTLLKGDKSSVESLAKACLAQAKKSSNLRLQELSYWTILFLQSYQQVDFSQNKYIKRTISRAIRLVLDESPVWLQAQLLDNLQAELKYLMGAWYGMQTEQQQLPMSSLVQSLFDQQQLQLVDADYSSSSTSFKVRDPDLLAQVDLLIKTVKEFWSQLSVSVDNKPAQLSLAFTNLHKVVSHLWPELSSLTQAMLHCIEQLIKTNQAVSSSLALEFATALLFLEDTIADVYSSDPDVKVKTEVMFHRLQQVIQNQDAPNLLPWMEALFRRSGDHHTIGNVAGELKQLVSETERNFELLFNDSKNQELLLKLTNLLNQMKGVLSVVGLDDAVLAVSHLRRRLDSIETDLQQEHTKGIVVQNIASNVATLGLMVDMLIYQPKLPAKVFRFDVHTSLLTMATSGTPDRMQAFNNLGSHYSEAAITSTFGTPLEKNLLPSRSSALQQFESESNHKEKALNQRVLKDGYDAAASWITPIATSQSKSSLHSAFAENKELDGEMRGIFTDEAQDVVEQGLGSVSALQLNSKDVEKLVSLRRGFHTLKGSARMVGLKELADAAWSMEQLLNEQLTNDTQPVSDDLCLLAQEALNLIGQWSAMVAAAQDPDWQAQPFIDAAQVMRQTGKYQSIGHILKGAVHYEPKASASSSKDEAVQSENDQPSIKKTQAYVPVPIDQTPIVDLKQSSTPTGLVSALQIPKVSNSQITTPKNKNKTAKNKKNELQISEFESQHGVAQLHATIEQDLDEKLLQLQNKADPNIHEIPPVSVIDFELSEIEALVNTGENKKSSSSEQDLEKSLDQALSVSASNEKALAFDRQELSIDTEKLSTTEGVHTAIVANNLDLVEVDITAEETSIDTTLPIESEQRSLGSHHLNREPFTQDNQVTSALEGIDFDNLDWQAPMTTKQPSHPNTGGGSSSPDRQFLQALHDIDLSLEDTPQNLASTDASGSQETDSFLHDDHLFADLVLGREKNSDAQDSLLPSHQEFDFLNSELFSNSSQLPSAESQPAKEVTLVADLLDPIDPALALAVWSADKQMLEEPLEWSNATPETSPQNDSGSALPKDMPANSTAATELEVNPAHEVLKANTPGSTASIDQESLELTALDAQSSEALELQALDNSSSVEQTASSAPDSSNVHPIEPTKTVSQTTLTSQYTSGPSEAEQYKLVGHLRIKFDLYSIFLQEADEKSRELDTVVSEWMLERDKPIPPEAEQCAHFLAGCSATVGLVSLSSLARLLEKVCAHVKTWRKIEEEEIHTIKQAVDAIRYLLHQFAAGFLKEPDTVLVAQLQRLCFVRKLSEPETEKVNSDSPDNVASLPVTDGSNAQSHQQAISQVLQQVSQAGLSFDNQSTTSEVTEQSRSAQEDDNDFNLPIDVLDTELLAFFLEESRDLLPELMRNSRIWTSNHHDREAKTEVLRALHTLKGSARLAGAYRLGEIVHRLEAEVESVPDATLSAEQVDDLLAWFDHIEIEIDHLSKLQENSYLGNQVNVNRVVLKPRLIDSELEVVALSEVNEALPIEHAIDHNSRLELETTTNTDALLDTNSKSSTVTTSNLVPTQDETSNLAGTSPHEVDLDRSIYEATSLSADQENHFLEQDPLGQEDDASFTEKVISHASEVALTETAANASKQVVRVSAKLLDQVMNQAGEVLSSRARVETEVVKLKSSLNSLTLDIERLREQLRELEIQAESQMQSRLTMQKETETQFDPLEFDRFTRVQELVRVMAESVSDVATVQRGIARNVDLASDELVSQGRQARELQRTILRTRMVEFDVLSERLYRTVRQAAKDVDKKVNLQIDGGTIELDRQLLDKVGPCLEHLIRNAVAHGIESATERLQSQKSESGHLYIYVHHDRNDVYIQFRDDGRGLDLDAISKKAVQLGMLSAQDKALTLDQAFELICSQGFSTASEVTEISGRGIGMDVVRSVIDGLGGRMEVANEKGKGFGVRLILPLTTATTQVLLVRCDQTITAIQVGMVEQVLRYSQQELQAAYQKATVTYAQDTLQFYWAGTLFGGTAQSSETHQKAASVVIVRSAGRRLAMHVDEVLNNQEVIVKNLGPQLSQLPGLTGVTILPSGNVVFIYNPVALALVYAEKLKAKSSVSTSEGSSGPSLLSSGEAAPAPNKKSLVMVVDDSITVRRVTERLLQRLGYRVVAAADGLQALNLLRDDYRQDPPCVVLADIEMPRMDGFDLLRSIRSDQDMQHLPVIMITSRLAEKHKDLAFRLGVNHYLGKPYSEEELSSLIANFSGHLKKSSNKS